MLKLRAICILLITLFILMLLQGCITDQHAISSMERYFDFPKKCDSGGPQECPSPLKSSMFIPRLSYYKELFYPACAVHDYCYKYGFITYGESQASCDNEFYVNMKGICDRKYTSSLDEEECIDIMGWLECREVAQEYYNGISNTQFPDTVSYDQTVQYFRNDSTNQQSSYCVYKQ